MITLNDGPGNDTRFAEAGARSDSEAAHLVELQLKRSGYSSLQDIVCDVCDGALRLRGRLPSHYLKQVALQIASAVAAGRPILLEIEVNSFRTDQERRPPSGNPAAWTRNSRSDHRSNVVEVVGAQ